MPTIDATKGGANANCYIAIAEADAILDEVYGAEDWATFTDDEKSRLLITASKMIDRLPISDTTKNDETQSMLFPLEGDKGWETARDVTPYQAMWLYDYGMRIRDAQANQIDGTTKMEYDELRQTMNGFNFSASYAREVVSSLGGYIDMSVRLYRG